MKLLSCVRLSDPMDCSLPGPSIHGIFQARVLEWGATAFSKKRTQKHKWTECYVNELYLLTNHPVFIGLKQQLPIFSQLGGWAEDSGNGSPPPQGMSWAPAHVCIQLMIHCLTLMFSSWQEAWRLLGCKVLITQQASLGSFI